MTSLTEAVRPARAPQRVHRIRWALYDGMVICKRNLWQIPRMPEVIVFSTVQPVMFVLLFAFVFGGAIAIPGGGSYREFLMAGIFVQTIAFNAAATAVGMADDMQKGLVDRFRSLPIARSAVLLGRTSGDLVRGVVVVVVMSLTGLAVGWRIHDGFVRALAAYLLLLAFGFAMSWIGAWIGVSVPNTEVANSAGFIWLFPLTFLSNAFVPLQGMPGFLQTLAVWNPVSAVVSACRDLFGNPNPYVGNSLPERHPIAVSLLWIIVILVVFVPLAVRKYRLATAR